MSTLTTHDAVSLALKEAMRTDPRILVFGEGVATKRADLLAEFGPARVRNTPLAEGIIAGTAVGASAMGLRPVIDMLFAPFLTLAMDALVNSAGKLRYLSGGQFNFPLVVLAQTGAGWGVGGQHNHNLEAMFVHAPGLKVVMPSNAADARGLLLAAIRDDNPVLFFTDIAQVFTPGEVPDAAQPIPLGKAALRRSGEDVSLIGYGKTVEVCLQAAQTLHGEGVDAEVLDLRSLKPLDEAAILASVRKTGRLVVAHEAAGPCGVGAEIAALVGEKAFDHLYAPVRRITGPDAPAAASWMLEQAGVPTAAAVAAAVREQMGLRTPQPA